MRSPLFLWACCLLISIQVQFSLSFEDERNYTVCSTPACESTARELLSSMDPYGSPCSDFYDFVCQNYHDNNPDIPGVKERDQFKNVQIKFMDKMKAMIEQKENPRDPQGVNLARKLYRTCMDTSNLDAQKAKLQQIIEEAGGWPLASPYNENSSDPVDWRTPDLQYIEKFASSWLYELSAQQSYENPEAYALTLEPPKVYRPESVNKKDSSWRIKYTDLIKETVRSLIGEDKYRELDRHVLHADIVAMIDLEEKLIKLGDPNAESCVREKISVRELHDIYAPAKYRGRISLHPLMNLITNKQFYHMDIKKRIGLLVNVGDDEMIQFPCWRLFEDMAVAITMPASTRDIVNYIHWRIVARTLPLIDGDLRNQFYPKQASKSRSEKCLEENEALASVLYEVINKEFPDENDEKATDVYRGVDSTVSWKFLSLREKLKGNLLRTKAFEKHEDVKLNFKRPVDYFDADDFRQKFPINNVKETYLENILAGMAYRNVRAIGRLRNKFVPKLREIAKVHEVSNVYVDRFPEGRYVAPGLLMLPFYDSQRPQSLNYGAFGTVVGHALMNELYEYLVAAYHKDGRIIDMAPESRDGFVKNARNISMQWETYAIKNADLPYSPEEDHLYELYDFIAERDAVQAAFRAYRKEAQIKMWRDERLPGLEEYSSDQLFFISYANSHCSALSREGVSSKDLPKVLGWERDLTARRKVIMSLTQIEEFGEVFKCRRGSQMQPTNGHPFW